MLPDYVRAGNFATPTVSYAICCNPRSGSTHLLFLLQSTGVLGTPYEWLRGDGGTAHWDYADYPADCEGQMQYVLRDGCTPNGVCAIKMFPEHFDTRVESHWAERMPDLKYVHLVRTDLLGQAISLSIARQTDSYGTWMPEVREAVYDADHIRRCIDFIAIGDLRWRLFFTSNGIEPLTLTYEEVMASPQESINRICALVGVPSAPISLDAFKTNIQRGDRNADWRRRFINDSKDLTLLPAPRNTSYAEVLWCPVLSE